MVTTLLLASYKGAPVVLLILAALLVGFGYVMRNAVIGRHVYAIGGTCRPPSCPGSRTRR